MQALFNQNSLGENFLLEIKKRMKPYKSWDDELSLHIFHWIKETKKISGFAAFQEALKGLLMAFRNPLNEGGTSLKFPLLDRKWVWEREQFEEYQRIFIAFFGEKLAVLSPYDREPMNIVPHSPGIEILTWLHSLGNSNTTQTILPQLPQPVTNEREVILREESHEILFIKLSSYLQLARKAVTLRLQRSVQAKIMWSTEQCEATIKELQSQASLISSTASQASAAHDALVEQLASRNKQVRSDTNALLQGQVVDAECRVKEIKERERLLAEKIEQQKVKIQSLS